MFILYGTRKKLKIDKSLGNQTCPNCHHTLERALAREKTAITLFYIPIIGWTSKKFILCPCCGDSQILSGAEYKELKNS
jgi:predicted RNA-binding Zn-ribbon protein involved in translation (DUF1610 family)